MSGIGKSWMMWGPRNEVKRRCKVEGRNGWFKCEICKQEREKIQIDHIQPVILPKVGFVDWNTYIASKFVEADKLQGICRDCHHTKTKAENKIRREVKKLRRK